MALFKKLFKLELTAALTGFSSSYHTGIMTICFLIWSEEFSINKKSSHKMTTTTTTGNIFGALIATILVYKSSRRVIILTGAAIQILGSIMIGSSSYLWTLILGRFIFGIGLGIAYVPSILYMAEWSPARLRGKMLGLFGVMSACGQTTSFLSGQIFTKIPHGWRIMVLLSALPSIFQIWSLRYNPESPRWLQSNGYLDQARDAIIDVHEEDDAEHELQILDSNSYQQYRITDRVIAALRSRSFLRALYINTIVQASQHLAGLNLVSYGIQLYIKESKTTPLQEFLQSALPLIVGAIITFFIVEVKGLGRKYTLVISLFTVALCLFILAAASSGETNHKQKDHKNFVILCIMEFHLTFHSLGLESIPSILNAESHPFRFMGVSSGLGAIFGGTVSVIVSLSFQKMLDDLGWSGAFLAYAGFTTVILILISLVLPETQGRELEDMEILHIF